MEVKSASGSRLGKYCGPVTPSPVISSGSIQVQFSSSYWSSGVSTGFLAFYQTGDSFSTPNPTYWTTYWPTPWLTSTRYPATYSPPKASIYACNRYHQTLSKYFLLSNFSTGFNGTKSNLVIAVTALCPDCIILRKGCVLPRKGCIIP